MSTLGVFNCYHTVKEGQYTPSNVTSLGFFADLVHFIVKNIFWNYSSFQEENVLSCTACFHHGMWAWETQEKWVLFTCWVLNTQYSNALFLNTVLFYTLYICILYYLTWQYTLYCTGFYCTISYIYTLTGIIWGSIFAHSFIFLQVLWTYLHLNSYLHSNTLLGTKVQMLICWYCIYVCDIITIITNKQKFPLGINKVFWFCYLNVQQ